jgi:DNA (cytosine-5)-methyltransferase 1
MKSRPLTSLEICAGGGGQALGLEMAGFKHVALVELDEDACKTLAFNRPTWSVRCEDLRTFDATAYTGVDLLAGGVPCPPFSIAGKQTGEDDERDLFPAALRLIAECDPRAVMLENVKGLLSPAFDDYRARIDSKLSALGYVPQWKLLHASDYGVPQLRPRVVCVALKHRFSGSFSWPPVTDDPPLTVGQALVEEMRRNGWEGAEHWANAANRIAPTLVGGSRKHGGPDLGPTRARRAWAALGVEGISLADDPPPADFADKPRLTVTMEAILQGFPREWCFYGNKTSRHRQVGNAFPPPVAAAVGTAITAAIRAKARADHRMSSGAGQRRTLLKDPLPVAPALPA